MSGLFLFISQFYLHILPTESYFQNKEPSTWVCVGAVLHQKIFFGHRAITEKDEFLQLTNVSFVSQTNGRSHSHTNNKKGIIKKKRPKRRSTSGFEGLSHFLFSPHFDPKNGGQKLVRRVFLSPWTNSRPFWFAISIAAPQKQKMEEEEERRRRWGKFSYLVGVGVSSVVGTVGRKRARRAE